MPNRQAQGPQNGRDGRNTRDRVSEQCRSGLETEGALRWHWGYAEENSG
jgi:hypothetical protein